MEPAPSGKPVDVYVTFVVASMGLSAVGLANVPTTFKKKQSLADADAFSSMRVRLVGCG